MSDILNEIDFQRPIEYRFWDIESPAMISWEEMQDNWEREGYYDSALRFDHWIPMEFIGRYDKNNVKIHELDIVKSPMFVGAIGVIMRDEERCGFVLKIKNIPYGLEQAEQLEVIGNLIENPELIKLL